MNRISKSLKLNKHDSLPVHINTCKPGLQSATSQQPLQSPELHVKDNSFIQEQIFSSQLPTVLT